MNIVKKLVIPQVEADDMNEILNIEEGHCEDYDRNDIIKTYTVDFENGYEVDIKVCNGNTPYVDSVLFYEGSEVQVLEISEMLLGEYYFEHNEHVFEIYILPEGDVVNE